MILSTLACFDPRLWSVIITSFPVIRHNPTNSQAFQYLWCTSLSFENILDT